MVSPQRIGAGEFANQFRRGGCGPYIPDLNVQHAFDARLYRQFYGVSRALCTGQLPVRSFNLFRTGSHAENSDRRNR